MLGVQVIDLGKRKRGQNLYFWSEIHFEIFETWPKFSSKFLCNWSILNRNKKKYAVNFLCEKSGLSSVSVQDWIKIQISWKKIIGEGPSKSWSYKNSNIERWNNGHILQINVDIYLQVILEWCDCSSKTERIEIF